MKYFSSAQIQEALRALKPHHPIFASTFFVLKKARIPIGKKTTFRLNFANDQFLKEHYRIHPKSDWFLRVFRKGGDKKQDWCKPDWASHGLQKTNTSTCKDVFLHEQKDNRWGFSTNYIQELQKFLPYRQKLSLFHLAVWFYKYKPWEEDFSRKDIINVFISDFDITPDEIDVLFCADIISDLSEESAFQQIKVNWQEIIKPYSLPEGVPVERSGILRSIEAKGVGPIEILTFEPSKRLNIIIGDNGLGKTFLLDLSWWALTQNWVERPAEPLYIEPKKVPYIKFVVSNTTQQTSTPISVKFSHQTLSWEIPERIFSISGLVVYARVDGSFAVWDPANRMLSGKTTDRIPPSIVFSREDVWKGKEGQIEGLLRDWTRWQERQDKYPIFHTFHKVLQKLAPSDMGQLQIGEPRRILSDAREIPTLVHPYGTVPIVFESAGIKRIATLAYLIVWAWEEHKTQAKLLGRKEERQMVILLDEAEAHLHPKWQRKILPALLEIAEDLHSELSLQLIVATHSPLVMASSEPIFDEEQDQVFHLGLTKSGKVEFMPVDFQMRGNIDSWLSSDFFGLNFPGSEKRSNVIQQAISLQESETTTKKDVEMISNHLKDLLSAEDPFWIRWLLYAEQFGVQL